MNELQTKLVQSMARNGVPIGVAAQVIAEAFGADRYIPTDLIEPRCHGSYVIGLERFADVLPELHGLHLEHYPETEKWREGIPMDPDYGAMVEQDRVGKLLQVTCRLEGNLVGQCRMYIVRSLHTQTLYGSEDTLFLKKAHRGGYVAVQMMRHAEKALLALGIREIRANSKLSNNAGALMRRIGYQPTATQFTRIFSAQEAAQILQGEARHEPAT